MNQHFVDTKDPVKNGELSDSFAKHFAMRFNENEGITRGDARNIAKVEILWQGKPIPSVKTFKIELQFVLKREDGNPQGNEN